MINKKNLPLYSALAIPVVMIIVVAMFIYLPGIGKKPQYNFVYVTGTGPYYPPYDAEFSVKDGHVVQNPIATSTSAINNYRIPKQDGVLYEYNTKTNQVIELSLADAQKLRLDASNLSPDGYEITSGNSGGGDLLFGGGGSDYASHYLRGHNRSIKLNLKLNGSNSYGNFQFLGWEE